ncbi:ABC transporter ATP-binding protein [Trueperella pyogenes]|uniref:ABC transporter ATP-binding protein n=1 Tax=Trueperella pyogenes TaxID=1661 RepID=A0A3Q9GLE4_9ACTO|nr:ABC transporter ATP-binding protein [Trueperella pyogenes]AWG03113.1 ABC transporter ATP-binding protein [Trueperella pyogenes]AWG15842.1 ABC transporter ATP-binding protein [Trueperella pyogenes]AZR04726.1 ABC transporter ATP-binding protein [Trueperella pyogenes]AZR07630.1 ABC transporter ATP-binding protein [Trueperella pyogenes]MCI7690558.1 ABC transporter ATP-binding protein [Trueperella pyogenes]
MEPLIHVDSLTKEFGNTVALCDLNLDLFPGRVVGLIGHNGSGKTTLLKILAGLISDYDGTVRIQGHTPGIHTKASVAFLPGEEFIDTEQSVADAVHLFGRFFADFDEGKASQLLDHFHISPNSAIKELSKGTREKMQIALVMSRRAKAYLLDEPISGVDPGARTVILEGILRDFPEDALLFISTHLVSDVETIFDDVVMLKSGRVLYSGNADDLRDETGLSIDALARKEYR